MDKKPRIETLYIDRPEISETFSDSIHSFSFDGQTMRRHGGRVLILDKSTKRLNGSNPRLTYPG